MDLTLNTATDIVKLLCNRLRKERLARQMTQADVAARSGVGVNTVSNLETGKNVGFENLVKVAMVLGYGDALEVYSNPRLTVWMIFCVTRRARHASG